VGGSNKATAIVALQLWWCKGPAASRRTIDQSQNSLYNLRPKEMRVVMPKICEFFGIFIFMYYEDHNPPHFHARYGEYEALIQITPLGLLKGSLPPRALSLVMEWAAIYQKELMQD
jgi:hypothetical protein